METSASGLNSASAQYPVEMAPLNAQEAVPIHHRKIAVKTVPLLESPRKPNRVFLRSVQYMEIIQNGLFLTTVAKPAAMESRNAPEIVQIPSLAKEEEIVPI